MSTLRRSQSPPPPQLPPAPTAKSRSTIVFDEWDGPCAPSSATLPPQTHFPLNAPILKSCFSGHAIAHALHPTRCHPLTAPSGTTRVVVIDKPCGKLPLHAHFHQTCFNSNTKPPLAILLPLHHALQDPAASCAASALRPTTAAGKPTLKPLPFPPPIPLPSPSPPPPPSPPSSYPSPGPSSFCFQATGPRRILCTLRHFQDFLPPPPSALPPRVHPSLPPCHRRNHCSYIAAAAINPPFPCRHRHRRRRRLHDPILFQSPPPCDRRRGNMSCRHHGAPARLNPPLAAPLCAH
jgi:hypothetical protein